MPKVFPFKAIRYSPEFDAATVTSPPYDVIDAEERAELLSRDPFNVIRLILPSEDVPRAADYERAASEFRGWISNGVLSREEEPSFYLYQMDHQREGVAGSTVGLVASLVIEPFDEGDIYPHERTRPGPKADRLSLMSAAKANLEPLWFFAAHNLGGLGPVVAKVTKTEPLSDLVDLDGVRHRLWKVVPEPRGTAGTKGPSLLDDLVAAISRTPLIMADGHHRYETATTYKQRMDEADGIGPWDMTLAFIVDPVEYPPALLPIHRVVEGLSLEALGDLVELHPFQGDPVQLNQTVQEAGSGTIGVISEDRLFTMHSNVAPDTTYLHEAIFAPAGVEPEFEHVFERAVTQAGKGATVFLLASTPIDLVSKMALAGERMPPKTTLFWPKPRSGLVFRDLEKLAETDDH
ncbi:MAG: DUF1015 family protein [Actinomycetota bacterium]|nr:DUF1015 domain-containing protein [Actinomycetota bacterium]